MVSSYVICHKNDTTRWHESVKIDVYTCVYTCIPVVNVLNQNSSLQDGFDAKYASQVTIYSDGSASWMPPAIQQSSCEGTIYQTFL